MLALRCCNWTATNASCVGRGTGTGRPLSCTMSSICVIVQIWLCQCLTQKRESVSLSVCAGLAMRNSIRSADGAEVFLYRR